MGGDKNILKTSPIEIIIEGEFDECIDIKTILFYNKYIFAQKIISKSFLIQISPGKQKTKSPLEKERLGVPLFLHKKTGF